MGTELSDYEPEWWLPSLESFFRLIHEVPQEWRALPFVSLVTSMGWGEATALDWRHVHFDR